MSASTTPTVLVRKRNYGAHLTPRQSRAVGAYLGLAVGDALGATVEFMTPGEIQSTFGVHDRIRGGGWLKLKRGQVTDDTEMAIALGAVILRDGQVHAHAAAHAFDEWMRGKPVDIGNTIRRGIIRFRQTGDPVSPQSEFDAGNGAAMRVLPAILATVNQSRQAMIAAVVAQAHVTHNNPLSDAACICMGDLVRLAMQDASKNELLHGPIQQLVEQYGVFKFRKRREENPSGYVVHTMRAVLEAFMDTDDFGSAMIDVVNRGGDADTSGAILGAIAGAYYGVDAIPVRWLRSLNQDILESCRSQALGLLKIDER